MSNSDNNLMAIKPVYLRLIFASFFVVITSVVTAYVLRFGSYKISDQVSDWGVFGDYIGGLLNPALSLISVLLILLTIKQQEISLKQNAKQIEISIEEVRKSVSAQEVQARTAEEQLSELLKKSEIDDYLRVLNMLLVDLEGMLSETIPCYRNPRDKRTLRSQLLELDERKNTEQVADFHLENNYFYQRFNKALSYFHDQLNSFEKLGQVAAYGYFKSRASEYSQLLSGINTDGTN